MNEERIGKCLRQVEYMYIYNIFVVICDTDIM
jgi:hypothetical protein